MGKYIDWALVEIEHLAKGLPKGLADQAISEAEAHLTASATNLADLMPPDLAERQAVRQFGSLQQYVDGIAHVNVKKSWSRGDAATLTVAWAAWIGIMSLLMMGKMATAGFTYVLLVCTPLFVVASFRARRWQVIPLAVSGIIGALMFNIAMTILWVGPVGDHNVQGPRSQIEDTVVRAESQAANGDQDLARFIAMRRAFAPTNKANQNLKLVSAASTAKYRTPQGLYRVYKRTPTFADDMGVLLPGWTQDLVSLDQAIRDWTERGASLLGAARDARDGHQELATAAKRALEQPFFARLVQNIPRCFGLAILAWSVALFANGAIALFAQLGLRWKRQLRYA